MRLLRWVKIFLDSQVNLCVPRGEPATSASRQRLGLGNLFHAQHIAIETARALFSSSWHRKLYVVNAQNLASSVHPMLQARAGTALGRNLRQISSAQR